MRDLLDKYAAARMLGMSVSWLEKNIGPGGIPSVLIGCNRRYRPEALEQWVRDQERAQKLAAAEIEERTVRALELVESP